MRVLRLFSAFLLAMLAVSLPASAQPSLYVCTPTSQVLLIDGSTGTTSVLYTHPSAIAFHDCVLGPNGRLFIAGDNAIYRLDPKLPSGFQAVPITGTNPLPYTPRGLAFNVGTLYFTGENTVNGTSHVYQMVDSNPADDDLTFPTTPTQLSLAIGSPGRGLAFDYEGAMIIASDSRLQTSTPLVPPAASLYTSGDNVVLVPPPATEPQIEPVGVAVNTCKEVLYADAASASIRRVGSAAPLVQFNRKDQPRYVEIGSDNTMYVVTTEGSTGAAKVWAAKFGFKTAGCGGANQGDGTLKLLVELKTKLSGPGKLAGLASSSATGIAVSATDFTLTNTLRRGECQAALTTGKPYTKKYDFGYHAVVLNFFDCAKLTKANGDANDVGLSIDALESTLDQVGFTLGPFPGTDTSPEAPIEAMRYSPMGGFAVQYRYRVTSGVSPFPNPPTDTTGFPYRSIFVFETQEVLRSPGVARTPSDGFTATYTQNVGDDYWIGSVDPAGARGDDISKRVVFNSGPIAAVPTEQCVVTQGEPFNTENPLFKQNQSINIKISVRKADGTPCTGGLVRLSIYREKSDGTIEAFMDVKSQTGTETMNYMNSTSPGTYLFNLDTAVSSTPYIPGNYVVTFSGTLFGPILEKFSISQ